MIFLLLYQDRPCKICKQLLLLLLFLVLSLHKRSSRRVSIENVVQNMQAFMDSTAENATSLAQSYYHDQGSGSGSGSPSPHYNILGLSPHYSIVVPITLVLLLVCALCMHFMIKYAFMCPRRAESIEGTQISKQAEDSKIELGLLPVAMYCMLSVQTAAAAPPLPASLALPLRDSQCAICLSEFRHGQKMRVLPQCGHGFHVGCIDVWLSAHASCPTCRFDLCTLPGLRSEKIEKPDLSSLPVNPLFQW